MRVLLVEDVLTDARRMTGFIEALPGWRVTHVFTLGAAKELVLASGAPFDLALVDLSLPDAQKLEAVHFARESLPDAVCVVITGEGQISTANAALRHGAVDYLVKGVDSSSTQRALQLAVTRRDLARQVKQSEENLRGLLTNIQDALFVLDQRGAVLFRNPVAEGLLVSFAGDSGSALQARPNVVEQTTVASVDGEPVPMEVRTRELTWAGQPARLVVLRDLRAERRAQDLEAHISKISVLAKTGDEAFKDWHDVKNKLVAIDGSIATLKRRLDGLPPSPHEDPDPALRASQAVEEILEIAKKYHQAGVQLRNVRESVDLATLVESKCHAYLARLGAVSLIRELNRVPKVLGDPVELGGVVENLLTNALKAVRRRTDRGTPGSIRVSAWADESSAFVSVSDDGPGFPPGPLERWFEARSAGDGTGWGLGLHSVQGCVQKHQGRVGIQSEPGRGATVWFSLPLAQTEAKKKRRVLLIDDDPFAGPPARRMLGLSYDVMLCEDGQEALDLLEEDRAFDVVICDLEMPRVDGREFYLQATARWPELIGRIVFCSGGALGIEIQRFLRENHFEMLVKPMRAEVAIATIEAIAERQLARG